ncbi:MAG: DUF5684 domain-containing protein [Oscillospiraceae bacterium]|nr:DUF5684 domain-containing protein [Oscillospiraceae bacterium]
MFLSTLSAMIKPLADYYSDYGYSDYGSGGEEVAMAAMAGFYVVYMVICIAVGVVGIIAYWKIFDKANKPGWHALIPFLNMYTLFDVIYGSGWKFLLMFVPGLNTVLAFFMIYRLGKAFNKSTGFIVGMIFLTPIFLLMLAFGKDRYMGPQRDCFI